MPPGDAARRYRVARARHLLADKTAALASMIRPHGQYVAVEHLPADPSRPRWGHGRPPHARLDEIIGRYRARYRTSIEIVLGYSDELRSIDRIDAPPGQPQWSNAWIPALDGACLYAFTRAHAPRRYVEVGSGNSTLFVHRARVDGGLGTQIISIDPEPRADVDAICDRVVRAPLETTDLSVFQELGAGDMVFVDNSHRVLMNSDVAAFFMDVLPELPSGVLVGIHDILLPSDYFPEWADAHLSEQYLLAAYLLGGGAGAEPYMAAFYVSSHAELCGLLEPLWRSACFTGIETRGWAFWFHTDGIGR